MIPEERKKLYPETLAPGHIRLVRVIEPDTVSRRLYGGRRDTLNLVLETLPFPPPADKPYEFVALSRNGSLNSYLTESAFANGVECHLDGPAQHMLQKVRNEGLATDGLSFLMANLGTDNAAPSGSYNDIRLAWVDELCVNSEDPKEVESHVTLIRDIYQRASETLIWIGDRNEFGPSIQVDDIIPDLYNADASILEAFGSRIIAAGIWELETNDALTWIDDDFPRPTAKAALQRIMHGEGIGNFPLDQVVALSQVPWFKDVWMPAALLYSTKAKFLRHDTTVSAREFLACVAFIKFYIANGFQPLKKDSVFGRIKGTLKAAKKNAAIVSQVGRLARCGMSPAVGTAAEKVAYLEHQYPRGGDDPGLLWWIARVNDSSYGIQENELSFHPVRDRYNALICLADEATKLGLRPCGQFMEEKDSLPGLVKPLLEDGQISALKLCRGPCGQDEPYGFLSKYRGGFNNFRLPSWGPDWTKPVFPPWTRYSVCGNKLFSASANLPQASPKAISVTESEKPGLLLHLRGVHVGRISALGTPFRPMVAAPESSGFLSATTLFTELHSMMAKSSVYTETERAEGIWRIPARDMEPVNYHLVHPTWRRATPGMTGAQYTRLRDVAVRPAKKQAVDVPALKKLWYYDALVSLWDARPAMLDTGHVGVVPLTSQVGDRVCIPLGSDVPFVTRRVSEIQYGLIGETFMYGMMDGQIKADEDQVVELIMV